MNQITITGPDDWHLHLRDHTMLKAVVAHSAKQFFRAIIMPNLKPCVATVEMALDYRQRILRELPADSRFQPYMALYLTDDTSVDEVARAAQSEAIIGFKLYPAGATTHSEAGISKLEKVYPILEAMQRFELPLLIHGEVTDPVSDIFDRERIFIDTHCLPIVEQFPALRIVMEHLTTRDAVEFVKESAPTVAATITAHHLLYNRNALLAGGIRPHYYCLPVLKREQHRLALLDAATSGNPKFFLGTDSAPHTKSMKESACGCAGCYTAYAALELYAEAFESQNRLDKLEQFASINGAVFYRLPPNKGTVTLEKTAWRVPEGYPAGDEMIVPLKAGEKLSWRFIGSSI